jgi:hypothetical protein
MRSLIVTVLSILAVATFTGCATQNGASVCQAAQATYNNIAASELAIQQEVSAEQSAIAALPADDPARKTLAGPLAKAQGVLNQVQAYLGLAKVAVMTLCPEAASNPAPVATPTTNP